MSTEIEGEGILIASFFSCIYDRLGVRDSSGQ